MKRPRTVTLKFVLGCGALALAAASFAQNGLTYLNGPKGGQIVFGGLDGGNSAKEGMGDMLRHIHGHYGNKPKVGRVFGDKSGTTVAAFFTVTAKTDHNKPISGLLIVSSPAGGTRSAAVLTDDSSHFRDSLGPMLKELDAKERATAPIPKAKSPGRSTPAAHLSPVSFPDGSGSISLPSGWHLLSAHGGAIVASGPNGEKLNYGIYLPVIDPSTPRGRQTIMNAQRTGRPLPANYVAGEYSADLGQTFQSICYQSAQKAGRQAPAVTIESVKKGNDARTGDFAYVEAQIDNHDGSGVLHSTAELVVGRPDRFGTWSMIVYQTSVPVALVDKERTTMIAVIGSYKVNGNVVNAESAQTVRNINAYSAAVLQRGRESQARTDETLREARQASDSSERGVQGFCNNLLDQSVITDANTGEHHTVSNDLSGLLVGGNPDRFQYVPTRDYLKGVDY